MNFHSSGNVSIEASQESFETDNHIHTDISENSDDSFHISQIESESNDLVNIVCSITEKLILRIKNVIFISIAQHGIPYITVKNGILNQF